MKLLFRQRMFSWLDSYDIYDEAGNTVFTVKGQLGWGHRLHIYDARGCHVGTVKQRVLTFLPQFGLYENDSYIGRIRKEFTLFRPTFTVECGGWQVQGEIFEWDYKIFNPSGALVAAVNKELFRWTDTYVINVTDPGDALRCLMVVLAIDAEKCSRD